MYWVQISITAENMFRALVFWVSTDKHKWVPTSAGHLHISLRFVHSLFGYVICTGDRFENNIRLALPYMIDKKQYIWASCMIQLYHHSRGDYTDRNISCIFCLREVGNCTYPNAINCDCTNQCWFCAFSKYWARTAPTKYGTCDKIKFGTCDKTCLLICESIMSRYRLETTVFRNISFRCQNALLISKSMGINHVQEYATDQMCTIRVG